MNTLGWIVGGLAAVLIISNWKQCSAGSQILMNGKVITDANGNLLVSPNPCGGSPNPCTVIPITHAPRINCLLNPFPGGL